MKKLRLNFLDNIYLQLYTYLMVNAMLTSLKVLYKKRFDYEPGICNKKNKR